MENKKTDLTDVFLYNGIAYSELTNDRDREIIDKMIEQLQKDNLAWIILTHDEPFFNIINPTSRHTTFEIQTNIPDDLNGKMTVIYTKVAFPETNG